MARHLRYGGRLLGICGGFQMLGQTLLDPAGIDGTAGSSEGLGWLAMDTCFEPDKQLRSVQGWLSFADAEVRGYEIHCGNSRGEALARPFAVLDGGRHDGAISPDGQVMGTYLHGVFDSPAALSALLDWAGLADAEALDLDALRERTLERLADAVEQYLDTAALSRWLALPPR